MIDQLGILEVTPSVVVGADCRQAKLKRLRVFRKFAFACGSAVDLHALQNKHVADRFFGEGWLHGDRSIAVAVHKGVPLTPSG